MTRPPPVDIEDLAGSPVLYNPIVVTDGGRLAFYYDETGRNELYLLDRRIVRVHNQSRRRLNGIAPPAQLSTAVSTPPHRE